MHSDEWPLTNQKLIKHSLHNFYIHGNFFQYKPKQLQYEY